MVEIILDEKFQSLLPSLDAETYRMLEESILEHGCLTPLVVWNRVLIDGYNRYRICTEHNIPFTTVSKDFHVRDEALIWMIENQIARRNLTPIQLSRFRGIHYRADRRLHGDSSRFTQKSEESQNGASMGSTANRLSELYGVSRDTIFRDVRVADAFEVMDVVSPEAVRMVLSNEVSINRGKLESLASGTKEQVEAVTEAILNGTYNRRAPLSAEDRDPSEIFHAELRKLDSIIKKMSGNVSSALQGNKTDSFSELKSTLRSCISTLESFYSSIPA